MREDSERGQTSSLLFRRGAGTEGQWKAERLPETPAPLSWGKKRETPSHIKEGGDGEREGSAKKRAQQGRETRGREQRRRGTGEKRGAEKKTTGAEETRRGKETEGERRDLVTGEGDEGDEGEVGETMGEERREEGMRETAKGKSEG